jgi:hypothetical protein
LTRVIFALLVLAGGCDNCKQGSSYCDGNQLHFCGVGEDKSPHWVQTGCPVACKQLSSGATCVDSPTPVPECANKSCVSTTDNACWKGGPTHCQDGYPTSGSTPCPMGFQCVLAAGCDGPGCDQAQCISDPTDLRCHNATTQLSICDGNNALSCWCGYVQGVNACSGSCSQGTCTN